MALRTVGDLLPETGHRVTVRRGVGCVSSGQETEQFSNTIVGDFMAISVSCRCGKSYRVADHLAGKKAKCKACGQLMIVPQPAAEPLIEADAYEVADGPAPAAPSVEHDGLSSMMVNTSTSASNAARMRVEIGTLLACYWPVPVCCGVGVVIGVVGWLLLALPALIISGGCASMCIWWVLHERAKFIGGDVNPGVVISERPWRMAVLADLSTGSGARPAIKIIRAPLSRMTGGPAQLGMRLATASLYAGRAGEDAWRDFEPTIVQCATRNEADIGRVMASIPARDWRSLDVALARLPARDTGLHRLWLEDEGSGTRAIRKWAMIALLTLICGTPLLAMTIAIVKKYAGPPAKQAQPITDSPTRRPQPAVPPSFGARRGATPFGRTGPRVSATRPGQPLRTPPAAVAVESARPTPAAPAVPPAIPVPDGPSTSREPATTTSGASAADFTAGQKVEIQWGNKWWPGNIVKREGRKLFVHYEGWGNNFDEWVTTERLRARH